MEPLKNKIKFDTLLDAKIIGDVLLATDVKSACEFMKCNINEMLFCNNGEPFTDEWRVSIKETFNRMVEEAFEDVYDTNEEIRMEKENRIKLDIIKKVINYQHDTTCFDAWMHDLINIIKTIKPGMDNK